MASVIATHEAGIDLLAKRAGEHPAVERKRFRFVDRFVAVTGAGAGDAGDGATIQRIFMADWDETRSIVD